MKLIYFAGPFSGDESKNTESAVTSALQVMSKNANIIPVVPHLFFPGDMGSVQCAEWYYNATLEVMKKCDAIFVFNDNYKNSVGTLNEIKTAVELGIPVIYEEGNL